MAKFTPVHYAREQSSSLQWVEKFAGAPVEMTPDQVTQANKQFEQTGVRYVKAVDNAPGPGTSTIAAPSGAPGAAAQADPGQYVTAGGIVVTGQPVDELFITESILKQYGWPTGVGIGDTVKVAQSGYVYIVRKAQAEPTPNQFQALANQATPRGGVTNAGAQEQGNNAGAATGTDEKTGQEGDAQPGGDGQAGADTETK